MKDKKSLTYLLSVVLFINAVVLWHRYYIAWYVLRYSLVMVLLGILMFSLTYQAAQEVRPGKKNMLRSIIGAGGSFAVSGFAVPFLINNVLQKGNVLAAKSAVLLFVLQLCILTVMFFYGKLHLSKAKKAAIAACCVVLAAIYTTGIFAVVPAMQYKKFASAQGACQEKLAETVERSYTKGGIMLNIDINSVTTPFLNEAAEKENFTKEELYSFVDIYKDLDITDLLFDVFCQYAAFDSKIWSTYADKYEQTSENGVEVDYKDRYKGIYKINKEYGIDPYEVWVNRCYEVGINPWISLRMNDCHEPDDDASFLRSDFFYEAKEKGWMIGDRYGYYRICYDYGVKEVRDRMLGLVKEVLDRYDMYGLELDFLREITCFDYLNNKDRVEIMNGFMRDVKRLVKSAEEKYGHEIKIGVRMQRDIEQCLAYGFDVKAWIAEDIIDQLTVSPRWESCDSDMPISDWRSLSDDIELAAGVETLILKRNSTEYSPYADAETVRGLAAQYMSEGADKLYLFNYFENPYYTDRNDPDDRNNTIFPTCGYAENVYGSARRHIVTYQDIAPEGFDKYEPLPISLNFGECQLEVCTGYIPDGMTAVLKIGFTLGSPSSCAIRLNGKALNGFEPTEVYGLAEGVGRVADVYCGNGAKCYECDITELVSGNRQLLTLASPLATVSYVEIELK